MNSIYHRIFIKFRNSSYQNVEDTFGLVGPNGGLYKYRRIKVNAFLKPNRDFGHNLQNQLRVKLILDWKPTMATLLDKVPLKSYNGNSNDKHI